MVLPKEPGRLRVAAHNLGEPMAVRPRVWCCRILQKTGKSARPKVAGTLRVPSAKKRHASVTAHGVCLLL
jgi:hypothetical protein